MSSRPTTDSTNVSVVDRITSRLSLATALTGVLGFIVIAILVATGMTQTIDDQMLLALRDRVDPSVAVGANVLGETVRDVTALGGFAVLISLTVCSVVYLRVIGDVQGSRFIGLAIVLGFVVSMTLKSTFARPRPEIVPHLTGFTMSSFPSSHAMMSAIIYLTLAWMATRSVEHRGVRVFAYAVALLLTIAIGGSRAYLGVHYPSDVLAGWCAGVAWVALSVLVAPRS